MPPSEEIEREPRAGWLSDRLALRPREAAAALGLSERKLREVLPSLPHVRVGGAILLPVASLTRWLEAQAAAPGERLNAEVDGVLRKLAR